ncbi:hypothetical protein [Lolliginicoccus suaedae]|uniref:hypothetical protein n=1 Tax=Lolliginicoccus suaedae TaxID=2605429 RepID=UPI0011EEFF79|nr:hypothetical protein [Lolliginicoccus suaedae]
MTSRVVRGIAAVESASDRIVELAALAVRMARRGWTDRVARRSGLAAGLVVLALYLVSIGDVVFSWSGSLSGRGVDVVGWSAAGQARAPYVFEPVAALHLGGHASVFISPVNLLLGLVVAILVVANVLSAVHASRHVSRCRTGGVARLAGVLPVFLLGFACCAPTFLLLLGTGVPAAAGSAVSAGGGCVARRAAVGRAPLR